MSGEEFKKIVTADQPEAPDSCVHDAILNRKERASRDDSMQRSLRPLTVDEVLVFQKEGAQLVDVRDGIDCEGGYRSAIAASLLEKLWVKDIHDMVGGYKAWVVAKLPTRV